MPVDGRRRRGRRSGALQTQHRAAELLLRQLNGAPGAPATAESPREFDAESENRSYDLDDDVVGAFSDDAGSGGGWWGDAAAEPSADVAGDADARGMIHYGVLMLAGLLLFTFIQEEAPAKLADGGGGDRDGQPEPAPAATADVGAA